MSPGLVFSPVLGAMRVTQQPASRTALNLRQLPMLFGTLVITACASVPPGAGFPRQPSPDSARYPVTSANATAAAPGSLEASAPLPAPATQGQSSGSWRRGEVAMQGYLGVGLYEASAKGGAFSSLQDEDATFPSLGGGGQWKLGGDKIDFGLEALLGFSWEAGATGFAAGSGGAAVFVEFDLLLFDLYGGPFVNVFLGDQMRLYAGAGPLLQWAFYDQDSSILAASGDGSGFGFGYYARTGFEFEVAKGNMLGFGARWSESEVDLDGNLSDLQVDGLLFVLTLSQGF